MGWNSNQFQYYKFTYYFSAEHSMNHSEKNMHPHTFTVTLYCERITRERFNLFHKVDEYLEKFFGAFTGEQLNQLNYFEGRIPSVEVMGECFYEDLKIRLRSLDMELIQLDICDNPVRVYSVSDRILMCSACQRNTARRLERLLEKQDKFLGCDNKL